VTVVGAKASVLTVAGLTVTIAFAFVPLAVAVTVEVACAATARVVVVNVPVVAPAATVTVEGTVAAEVLLDVRLTTRPPVGAGPVRVTVVVSVAPPITAV